MMAIKTRGGNLAGLVLLMLLGSMMLDGCKGEQETSLVMEPAQRETAGDALGNVQNEQSQEEKPGLKALAVEAKPVADDEKQTSAEPKEISAEQAQSILSQGIDTSVVGSDQADVKVYMFQDLKCGMCGYAFREIIKQLKTEYVDKGRVRVVFKEFPLGFRQAEAALSEALLCAGEQGRYYDFIDYLYSNMKTSDAAQASEYAAQLGLDKQSFEQCVAAGKYRETVRKDYELGQKLGVVGTPNFFINGRNIPGAGPYDGFKKIVDEELAKAQATN